LHGSSRADKTTTTVTKRLNGRMHHTPTQTPNQPADEPNRAPSARDLDVVLGLAGATGATVLCYVLPGVAYARVFSAPHALRTLALAQLAVGCVVGPAAATVILLEAFGVL